MTLRPANSSRIAPPCSGGRLIPRAAPVFLNASRHASGEGPPGYRPLLCRVDLDPARRHRLQKGVEHRIGIGQSRQWRKRRRRRRGHRARTTTPRRRDKPDEFTTEYTEYTETRHLNPKFGNSVYSVYSVVPISGEIVRPSPPMKPNITLAETKTPNGARMTLVEQDGSYCIRVNGQQ